MYRADNYDMILIIIYITYMCVCVYVQSHGDGELYDCLWSVFYVQAMGAAATAGTCHYGGVLDTGTHSSGPNLYGNAAINTWRPLISSVKYKKARYKD